MYQYAFNVSQKLIKSADGVSELLFCLYTSFSYLVSYQGSKNLEISGYSSSKQVFSFTCPIFSFIGIAF